MRPTLFVTLSLVLACRRTAPARPRPPAPTLRDATPPAPPLDPAPAPSPPRAFRFGRTHDGRSGYLLPHRLRIAARVTTHGRISAQPVLLPSGDVLVGSHDGILYAAHRDGTLAWRVATGDRVYTTALVTDNGTIYSGTDADRFLAITPAGGVHVALGTDDDADTSPALAPDGTLRFASGHTLYSVDPDLTVRFRLDLGGKIFSSPAITDDGTAIFGCQDDGVYAVAPGGTVRWRFATGDDVDAPPAIDPSGNIYVGSDDGNFYCLNPEGTERWRHAVGGYVRAGAALGLDGTVIVGTYGPRPRVVALDRTTGAERWELPVAGPPTRDYGIASAPMVDREGSVAFGAPDDALYVLARDGTVTARLQLPDDVDSAPVLLDDGVLAVGCDDGVLYVVSE